MTWWQVLIYEVRRGVFYGTKNQYTVWSIVVPSKRDNVSEKSCIGQNPCISASTDALTRLPHGGYSGTRGTFRVEPLGNTAISDYVNVQAGLVARQGLSLPTTSGRDVPPI